jgi:hypothetical protein
MSTVHLVSYFERIRSVPQGDIINHVRGEWKAGKYEGRGTYRAANGDVYEGGVEGRQEGGA